MVVVTVDKVVGEGEAFVVVVRGVGTGTGRLGTGMAGVGALGDGTGPLGAGILGAGPPGV